jgi:WD40 repeat protein
VWDVRTFEPVILLNSHATQVTAVAFSADGRRLATADSAQAVHVWDFDARKELQRLSMSQAEIPTLAFSPDGKRLACSGERMIHVWDAETGQALLGAGPRPVGRTTVAVHPDGTRLASNAGGPDPRVWDTATRQPILTLEAPSPVHGLAYSPDGRWLAGAVEDRIRLWDGQTGRFVADWDGPDEPVTLLAFSADSTTLASGGRGGLAVWLWRVADGEPILLIPDALDNCAVESIAFHPGGRLLAAGGIDWLATGGSNGAASLWDLAGRFESAIFLGGTTALAFHPSGERLATTTLDNSVCVWALADQQLLSEMTGHEGALTCLAYSPDGRFLATGSEDSTVRLWTEAGEPLAVLEVESHPTALAFAADGRALYVGHANTTCSQIPVGDLLPRGR